MECWQVSRSLSGDHWTKNKSFVLINGKREDLIIRFIGIKYLLWEMKCLSCCKALHQTIWEKPVAFLCDSKPKLWSQMTVGSFLLHKESYTINGLITNLDDAPAAPRTPRSYSTLSRSPTLVSLSRYRRRTGWGWVITQWSAGWGRGL